MIPLSLQETVRTSSIEDVALREEAVSIASYLLNRRPKDEIIDRYVAGVTNALSQPRNALDEKVQSFIRRHPKSLPCLDAASAFIYPKRLLRNKILLMAAILEATPDYCDEFFPAPFSKGKFVLEIISIAVTTTFQVCAGLILFTFIRLKGQ